MWRILFTSKLCSFSEDHSDVLYTCTCSQSSSQRDRLSATNTFVEDIQQFIRREQSHYCIHARVCKKLMFPSFEPGKIAFHTYFLLQFPLLSIIKSCCWGWCYQALCRTPSDCCSWWAVIWAFPLSLHQSYVEWCKDNDIDIEHKHVSEPPAEFCSISTKKIPYPFSTIMKQQHDDHECGKWQFPFELVPKQSEGLCSSFLQKDGWLAIMWWSTRLQ